MDKAYLLKIKKNTATKDSEKNIQDSNLNDADQIGPDFAGDTLLRDKEKIRHKHETKTIRSMEAYVCILCKGVKSTKQKCMA